MAAVAACFVAEWKHNRAPVRDALDLALQDAQLGRVDQVVGEVDGQQRRTDLAQPGTGVIILRAFHGIKEVIGVRRG